MSGGPFHNTVGAFQPQLGLFDQQAGSQELLIAAVFRQHGPKLGPRQVMSILQTQHQKDWEITSIRRAITNLTSFDKYFNPPLRKTEEQRKGEKGVMEHLWEIVRSDAPQIKPREEKR